ncbi:MAG: type transport system permease protein [Pseudonocardiales bacterium]|nr:type transport system permease protein [Pseudonocardiales bacterium]
MTAPGVLQYRSLIWNFAQRDLKSRFKGTAIGWAWSLLLPLASLFIYTLVAHYIFRAVPEPFGDGRAGNFAVWLFVGLTAWSFFANAVNVSMAALLGTGTLLQKIYFPSFAPVLGAVIGVIIQSAIEIALVLIVLCIFTNVGITWLLLPVWIALFVGFTAGAAMLFAVGNIYFRDLAHIISVVLQLLFYATPVLYQDNLIKDPILHKVILSNPLTEFVLLFRDLAYSLTPGRLNIWAGAVAWTAVSLGLATFVFHRYGRDLAEQM